MPDAFDFDALANFRELTGSGVVLYNVDLIQTGSANFLYAPSQETLNFDQIVGEIAKPQNLFWLLVAAGFLFVVWLLFGE
jgi:hypothetical protein